ncbi:hypothetical protein [Candidatus Hecatella orcuttiae]|jgi:hypothetical protein|uniref:hypothetical protein n=1 Tax=Candidatus Hecatella orcuttiae TaxID=1935119 RepID=UPI002867DD76|nr:hypothetical protein [Candidatus Hecatella orcuttiae]
MAVEAKVSELERKVDILSRALYLILFEENEILSKKELDELRTRLNEYLEGRKSKFIPLRELLDNV